MDTINNMVEAPEPTTGLRGSPERITPAILELTKRIAIPIIVFCQSILLSSFAIFIIKQYKKIMNLFIVESFSKCKKIKSFLNQTWNVQASGGHISDLPVKALAIDLESYEPDFVVMDEKRNLVKQLKQKIKKDTQVYLAMDPDFEGERIAFELAKHLNLKNPIRITFNEITQQAILYAIQNPQRINQHHVDAQTCRRVLDRLIGYQLSPVLRNITGVQNASVGRCISVVTKMIKEREEAIENHVFSSNYTCVGNFIMKGNCFKTNLNKTFVKSKSGIKFFKTIKWYI